MADIYDSTFGTENPCTDLPVGSVIITLGPHERCTSTCGTYVGDEKKKERKK